MNEEKLRRSLLICGVFIIYFVLTRKNQRVGTFQISRA